VLVVTVPEVLPGTGAVAALEATAVGVNVPAKFQYPENPLKGPPTIWLDH
jgi:hypothetical protein